MDLREWEAKKRLDRATLPDQWKALCRFIPRLYLERVRTKRRTLELTDGSIAPLYGKVAEWYASEYTVDGMLEGIGI